MCFGLGPGTRADDEGLIIGQDLVEGHFRYFVVRPRWDRDPIPQLAGSGQSRVFLTSQRHNDRPRLTQPDRTSIHTGQPRHLGSSSHPDRLPDQVQRLDPARNLARPEGLAAHALEPC